jgi:preprotein translocase subunit YajC
MSVAHAADFAFARAQIGGGSGGGTGAILTQLAFFAAIFAIFYFLLIRPQQRQKRDREGMLQALKKGDRIVTTSGLHGTVLALSKDETKDTIVLRVSDQVKLEFDRASVGRIVRSQDSDA